MINTITFRIEEQQMQSLIDDAESYPMLWTLMRKKNDEYDENVLFIAEMNTNIEVIGNE